VTLKDTPTLKGSLYGGYSPSSSSGNTLDDQTTGVTVGGNLGFFQVLKFQLSAAPTLNVTGTADVSGASVSVSNPGALPLAPGAQFTLIHAKTLTGTAKSSGTVGGYNYTVAPGTGAAINDLVLTIGAAAPLPSAATPIPTLGNAALAALGLLLAALSFVGLRRGKARG
jgi:hypothetical protein